MVFFSPYVFWTPENQTMDYNLIKTMAHAFMASICNQQKRISPERASQQEWNGANLNSVSPSREEFWSAEIKPWTRAFDFCIEESITTLGIHKLHKLMQTYPAHLPAHPRHICSSRQVHSPGHRPAPAAAQTAPAGQHLDIPHTCSHIKLKTTIAQ